MHTLSESAHRVGVTSLHLGADRVLESLGDPGFRLRHVAGGVVCRLVTERPSKQVVYGYVRGRHVVQVLAPE